jgi:hypothetical protein
MASEGDIKRLIRSPKPAFAAEGTTLDPERGSSFRAVFDGRAAWMIKRPGITELRAGDRTILVKADVVEVIDIGVSVNNDIKSLLFGRIAYLESGSLEIEGTTVVAGPPCHQVWGRGLKRDSDAMVDMGHRRGNRGCPSYLEGRAKACGSNGFPRGRATPGWVRPTRHEHFTDGL